MRSLERAEPRLQAEGAHLDLDHSSHDEAGVGEDLLPADTTLPTMIRSPRQNVKLPKLSLF